MEYESAKYCCDLRMRMDKELSDKLAALAKERKISKAAVVRALCRAALIVDDTGYDISEIELGKELDREVALTKNRERFLTSHMNEARIQKEKVRRWAVGKMTEEGKGIVEIAKALGTDVGTVRRDRIVLAAIKHKQSRNDTNYFVTPGEED